MYQPAKSQLCKDYKKIFDRPTSLIDYCYGERQFWIVNNLQITPFPCVMDTADGYIHSKWWGEIYFVLTIKNLR